MPAFTLSPVSSKVCFRHQGADLRINNIVLVGGNGDAVTKKILPAIDQTRHPISKIAIVDVDLCSRVTARPHFYYHVERTGDLPLERLDADGFLDATTLWILATPAASRARLLRQVAGHCPVALEKPLAATSAQARLLRPFALPGQHVYPIDHKLFNPGPLAFVDSLAWDPALLSEVGHFQATFYEADGIGAGRHLEDCLGDIQWHSFAIAAAALLKAAPRFDIDVERVQVAKYQAVKDATSQTAGVWTASRVQGRLFWNEFDATFDFCQAKGAARNGKRMQLFDRRGSLIRRIDFNETGPHAHARVLHELFKPAPDMRHTLADAIALMEVIERCRAMAQEEPAYPLGQTPPFADLVE